MLNRVESVIRCYDPCLSCSTHALGQMALRVQLLAPGGTVLSRARPVTVAATGRVLVVGYGNPLRGDDGAGPVIAERLGSDARLVGVDVRAQHQLTPELARRHRGRVARGARRCGGRPRRPARSPVRTGRPRRGDGSAWSHHVDPVGLVGLAYELWGAAPPVFTVCVGAASMEIGDGLSPAVAAAIPGAVDAVAAIVEAHGHA